MKYVLAQVVQGREYITVFPEERLVGKMEIRGFEPTGELVDGQPVFTFLRGPIVAEYQGEIVTRYDWP